MRTENYGHRAPGYETSDGTVTISPAETRSGTVGARRASWAGQGKPDRGTPRQADTARPDWQTEAAHIDLLKLRARLAGLGA